jgi:nucleotide-binding universal stress UspA family protein
MKILIVIDEAVEINNILGLSAQIVQRISDPPTILTVIPESNESLSSRAKDILARAVDIIGVRDAKTLIRVGEPFENIVEEATIGNFDLVILGEKPQRNLLSRLIFDSKVIKVAESAPCSVLIIRKRPKTIHRILLCDSGAGSSSLLSRFVIQLSDLLEGEEDVTVLHVMSQMSAGPGIPGSQLRADAQELVEEHSPEGEILERDIHLLDKPGIHPIPKIRHGLVVDEIIAEARNGDYDLVVVGAHSLGIPQNYLLDNIAHQIIKRINRPILIVRSKG